MKSRVLHLNLYRRHFDAIADGTKTVEYRNVTPYWTRRIENRAYDEIKFRNGYRKDSPVMRVEYLGWRRQQQPGIYVLKLGRILSIKR